MTTKTLTHLCVATVLLLCGANVLAAAFKCTNPGGAISYSDAPCPTTASKGEKLLGRGAGTNPLTNEEKVEFKVGILSQCSAPRSVCECVGDFLAESLTYEEIMQAHRKRGNNSVDIQDFA